MHDDKQKADLEKRLKPLGQEHLLKFWGDLDSRQRQALAEQIEAIDFGLLKRLTAGKQQGTDWAALAGRAKSPPAFRLGDAEADSKRPQATAQGEAAIRAGHVGAILVAGGQGTRLGFDHPKGMYEIGPVSRASLFQVLFEKLLAVGRRFGAPIPLYLMTSPATHAETVEYLARHDRHGLAEKDLFVFCQRTMPAVDIATGRLLLEDRGKLFLSPDGHGGMLAALAQSGALADIARRGLRQLFYMQVDNPLVRACDPEFIGFHLLAESELSTQVVARRDPADKLGNVVSVDGQVRIIEYSDLPKEAAERRGSDGSLALWAGNVAVHVFDVEFLSRIAKSPDRLPFHLAKKKVDFVDESGRTIAPDEPNAYKFERFIFDLLPEARQAIVVEVDREETFAPVKNAPGDKVDTPELAQRQMIALHTAWLRQAGADVAPGAPVEIGPLFALDAEQTAEQIAPATKVAGPAYFEST